jgi:hypothetical protein
MIAGNEAPILHRSPPPEPEESSERFRFYYNFRPIAVVSEERR